MADDGEFEAFAALLHRGRDAPDMVASLADRLERALPDHVDVERGGFRRRIKTLTVGFEPEQFRIEMHGHRTRPLIDHVVRGVCVRTDEVEMDDWLDRLARALADEATKSTTVRLALEAAWQ